MPISGGPPGLTFAFEREEETVPGVSNLVLGDSKIISAVSSTSSDCQLESLHQAGTWNIVEAPDASIIDVPVNRRQVPGFISIEAGQWRIVNTNAAARIVRLSVINVG